MSDNSIAIIPKRSTYPNNTAKAKEILDWLISKDVVKSTPSDCILGPDHGYAVSQGAKNITGFPEDLPVNLLTNGLQIITERQVFYAGVGDIEELICPHCEENIAYDDWDFTPWSNNETDNLVCTQCGHQTEIHNYKFEPEWGFSDLGFVFWNWPEMKEEFINDFKKKLDGDISIVLQHI